MTVVFNDVDLNACLVIEKEDPKCGVVSTDLLRYLRRSSSGREGCSPEKNKVLVIYQISTHNGSDSVGFTDSECTETRTHQVEW